MNDDCAGFCDLPAPTLTTPDDAHGLWCISAPIGREIRAHVDAETVEITIDRVRSRLQCESPTWIRLVVDPVGPTSVRRADMRLTTGAARQLAATLLRAADLADELLTLGSAGPTRSH